MKAETLNNTLIEAIKEKIPDGMNITNVLMDVLLMGKEAVYRRIRGEVPFTFKEATLISQILGVSLDGVSSVNSTTNALFGLSFINYANPFETHYIQNEKNIQLFNYVKDDPFVEWYTASNIIPQVFYLLYDNLSRFLLFKWIYQHERIKNVKSFSQLNLNHKLRNIQKYYVEVSQGVAYTCFIWDNMMFYHLINDIKYFASIRLVTEEDIKILKEEILELLNYLENLALSGYHKNGNRIQIYVSNINFEATYSYLESTSIKTSFIRVYSINMISTMDEEVFNNQKDWIQSLKRYSTLISESGEMQRIQYFNKQRKYVEEYL